MLQFMFVVQTGFHDGGLLLSQPIPFLHPAFVNKSVVAVLPSVVYIAEGCKGG